MAKKSPAIDCATLVSPTHAAIGAGDTCLLLDVQTGIVVHRVALPSGALIGALASPSGEHVILGVQGADSCLFTTAKGTLKVIGETLNGTPLGWADDETFVLSRYAGGIARCTIDGEVHAAKFWEDELHEDEEIGEHRTHDTAYAAFDRGTVFQVIDGDTLNIYDIEKDGVRHRESRKPPGKHMIAAAVRICGDFLVLLRAPVAKVLRRSDCTLVADYSVSHYSESFCDLTNERLFVRRGENVLVFDPTKGTWRTCAEVKKARALSVAADVLLVQREREVAFVSLSTGEETGRFKV